MTSEEFKQLASPYAGIHKPKPCLMMQVNEKGYAVPVEVISPELAIAVLIEQVLHLTSVVEELQKQQSHNGWGNGDE